MDPTADSGQRQHRVRLAGTWRQTDALTDQMSKIYWVDAFAEPGPGDTRVLTPSCLQDSASVDPTLRAWLENPAHSLEVVALSNAADIGQALAATCCAADENNAPDSAKSATRPAPDDANFVLTCAPTYRDGSDWCAANTVTAGALIHNMYGAGYRRASAECRLAVAAYRSASHGLARFLNDTESGQHYVRRYGLAALQKVAAAH